MSGFSVTAVPEREYLDSGTGSEPLIWLESEDRVRFVCSRCVARTAERSLAGSVSVRRRSSTDPWCRDPMRPDDIQVVLAPAWRLASVRARARALRDIREVLHSTTGVFPDSRLAHMTSLSKGTVSEYLSIAQLDPLIATVADEIRQAGGWVDDQVLNELPWRPFRPIIREPDPSIQKAMIRAAYLAHLEGRSCSEIQRRVIAAANQVSALGPDGESSQNSHTPTPDGSVSGPGELPHRKGIPEIIRRHLESTRNPVRCVWTKIRRILRDLLS